MSADLNALTAARAWASEHGHSQPDDRMLRTYGAALLQDQQRRLNGLEADLRSARRDVRELTAERDQARRERDEALSRLDLDAWNRITTELTQARQLNNQLADVIGSKQDVIAEQAALIARLRDHDEQRDRIWAGHDTTSGQEE